MATSQVVLGYWTIRGFGESIRTFLEYLEIPYVEEKYQEVDEWLPKKKSGSMPFPNLPYLIDGDFTLTESEAILAYLALKANKPELNGKDEDRVRFLQLRGVITETGSLLGTYAYFSKDLDELKQKCEIWMSWWGGSKLPGLNDLLGKNEWVMGYLTYLDFILAEITERNADMDAEVGTKITTDYPNLIAHSKRLHELPAVKAYRQTDRFQRRPYFRLVALWK
jgi:glutathione S-transferase